MNTKIVKPILGQIMILMLLLTGSSAFADEDVHKLVIQVSTDDVRTQNIAMNNAVNLQRRSVRTTSLSK